MIHAYDEFYLDCAMTNLADAFDCAVNECNISLDKFMEYFIASGFADRFGNGDLKFVAGMSGIELVKDLVLYMKLDIICPKPMDVFEASSEYWCGYVLAYYQWKTGMSFRKINDFITISEIMKMYPTLHEADIEKLVDTLNNIYKRKHTITYLQIQRKICGYSQKELSEKSGVNIRTLQQYEVGLKNINKASVETVLALAKVLGCSIETILEHNL